MLSLGSLREWRHESCNGEAAREVKRRQKAPAVPGNNLSLHISSCSGFNIVNGSTVMREGKEERWDWTVGILGFYMQPGVQRHPSDALYQGYL